MTERATEGSVSAAATPRRHDLDWLRLIAIFILLFFHTGMWFSTWGWHVKNDETSPIFNYWMVWLHYWRMPLLLFISGAGTVLAMGKRTLGQFRTERFRKLIIPLLFGMLVIVPPQIYYEHILKYDGYWSFYKTVFEFVPYPKGSLSWHHLWFILYLFLYSMLILPLLSLLREGRGETFRRMMFRLLSNPVGLLLVPAGLMVLSQGLLRPFYPDETHALLDDWSFFTLYFLFFFFGIVSYAVPKIWTSIGDNRKYSLAATGIILLVFYTLYGSFYGWATLPWPPETVELMFDITSIILGWFTVITIIGYGQHHLNRHHPWLTLAGEGLYPFYILHQTLIIVLGYYICQLDTGIFVKFWLIAGSTLGLCILIYMYGIKPFELMRLLFGMKSKRPKTVKPGALYPAS
ncbi:MAG: acyltransferase family protein [Cytophagales bacterium]|nr:acyltransferase family protein [Cytophagales bacterium]